MFRIAFSLYEGSVSGLLSLVKKGRISPLGFEIAKITGEYIEWLKRQDQSSSEQSNLLVFLSELVLIKSLFLLPKPQVIQDKQGPIINYLEEYKEYKEAANWIEERIKEQDKKTLISFKQENKKGEIELSIFSLFSSLKEILEKNEEPTKELIFDEPSLEDEIERVKERFTNVKRMKINMLLDVGDKIKLIVTFLAILELIRLRFLKAIQYRAFSPIWIIKR